MKKRILLPALILTAAAFALSHPAVFAADRHQPSQQPTPGPPDREAVSGTVSGEAVNGTNGEPVVGIEISLSAFSDEGPLFSISAATDSSGSFKFEDVELNPDWIYLAAAEFDGVRYSSMPAVPAGAGTNLFLQLLVYESTTDVKDLSINRLHLAFDFLKPGYVRVGELWVLDNESSLSSVPPGGLVVHLPAGFSDLEVDPAAGSDLTVTDHGFLVEKPFLPGGDAGSLMFSYSLPYKRSLSFNHLFPLPVHSGTVLVPAGGITLESSRLTSSKMVNLSGTSVQTYSLASLPEGETLQLQLTGSAPGTGVLPPSRPAHLAAGAAMLFLACLYAWHVFRSRDGRIHSSDADMPGSFDEAVRRLAVLDSDFESGRLSGNMYLQARASLKKQASVLYRGSDDNR